MGFNPYLSTFDIIWMCQNVLEKRFLGLYQGFFNWNYFNDAQCTSFSNSVRFPKAIKFKNWKLPIISKFKGDFSFGVFMEVPHNFQIYAMEVNPYLGKFKIILTYHNVLEKLFVGLYQSFSNWNRINDARCTSFGNRVQFPKAIKFKNPKWRIISKLKGKLVWCQAPSKIKILKYYGILHFLTFSLGVWVLKFLHFWRCLAPYKIDLWKFLPVRRSCHRTLWNVSHIPLDFSCSEYEKPPVFWFQIDTHNVNIEVNLR